LAQSDGAGRFQYGRGDEVALTLWLELSSRRCRLDRMGLKFFVDDDRVFGRVGVDPRAFLASLIQQWACVTATHIVLVI
jgi:hypothetical protein